MITTIKSNTTWKTGETIELTGSLEIYPGATLTIQPGVTVVGAKNTITVYGKLVAVGTQAKPILFDKVTIRLSDSSQEFGEIRFEHVAMNEGVFLEGNGYGSFDVINSTFNRTGGSSINYPKNDSSFTKNVFINSGGLFIYTKDGTVTIENNLFANWSNEAVMSLADYNEGTIVKKNSFLPGNQSVYALALPEGSGSNAGIVASDNYFFTTDPEEIDGLIADQNDSLRFASYINSSFTELPDPGTPDVPIYIWASPGRGSSVMEGESAEFILLTANVQLGTRVNYVVTGVSEADVVGGLSGSAVIGPDGRALISLPIVADYERERSEFGGSGYENLYITVEGSTTEITINDTDNFSYDPVSPPLPPPNPGALPPPPPTPTPTPTPTPNPTPTPEPARVNTLADESFEPAAGETRFEVSSRFDSFTVQSPDGGKTWQLSSSETGTDTLTGFKRITFEDKTVALDFAPQESGYESAMLIGAAFGKEFVPAYFSAGLSLFDLGRDTAYVCDLIVGAGLIEAQIGDASDRAWVKHVYKNVVGVDPDPLTELVLIDFLASGQFTRSSLLATAAELPLLEVQVDIAGLQTTGLAYTPLI